MINLNNLFVILLWLLYSAMDQCPCSPELLFTMTYIFLKRSMFQFFKLGEPKMSDAWMFFSSLCRQAGRFSFIQLIIYIGSTLSYYALVGASR